MQEKRRHTLPNIFVCMRFIAFVFFRAVLCAVFRAVPTTKKAPRLCFFFLAFSVSAFAAFLSRAFQHIATH